jgi:hypothetical protein
VDGADDWLHFAAGEILAVADLAQLDAPDTNGCVTGYHRAGDWGERRRFRADVVRWLPGLSTDEVCSLIIKPETATAAWPADVAEWSYARMVVARGEDEGGVGTATVFASHAWTFFFEELVAALWFFEGERRAVGLPTSYFWLVRISTKIEEFPQTYALFPHIDPPHEPTV